MKEIKNVESTNSSILEKEFDFETVFIRSNIKKITKLDEKSNENIELWVYDEKQYSYKEYAELLDSELKSLAQENAELKIKIANKAL